MVTKRDAAPTNPSDVTRSGSLSPVDNVTRPLGSFGESAAARTTGASADKGEDANAEGDADDTSDWNRFGAHEMPDGLREKLIHATLPTVPPDQLFDTVPPNRRGVAPNVEVAPTSQAEGISEAAASAPPVRVSIPQTEPLPLRALLRPSARQALLGAVVIVPVLWAAVVGWRWLTKPAREPDVATQAASAPTEALAAPSVREPAPAPVVNSARAKSPAEASGATAPPGESTPPRVEPTSTRAASTPAGSAARTKTAPPTNVFAPVEPPIPANPQPGQKSTADEPTPKLGSALDSKALPRLE